MDSSKIPVKTADSLREYINKATGGDKPTIPQALLHITDSKNNTLFSHGSSPSQSQALSSSSIFIIHSLTKLIGAIAFLQLVDRNLVTLDDPHIIPNHLPELAAQKILTGYITDASGKKEWHFEDRHGDITPRMLLTHTYGGGHTFFNVELHEYFQELGISETMNEVTDSYGTILASPLLWQPGTRVNYGQGMDWIAVLIERVTKMSLGDYLYENIFCPLGLEGIGMEPGFGGDVLSKEGNEGRFWPRVMRLDGTITTIDTEDPALVERDDAWPKGTYHNGRLGTGLMSSAENYTRLMSIFLPENNGVDPVSGHRLLTSNATKEIISPQLPPTIANTQRHIPSSNSSPITLPILLSAPHLDPKGSFGLACGIQGADRQLASGQKGRRKGSVYWYGAANTECWIDGTEGIVVFINGNYYPWNEGEWVRFVGEVEGILYEDLAEGELHV